MNKNRSENSCDVGFDQRKTKENNSIPRGRKEMSEGENIEILGKEKRTGESQVSYVIIIDNYRNDI